MADIFTYKDVQELLRNKYIWFFGDSNVRAMYKDIVWLLQRNKILPMSALKSKLERSFMNDLLVAQGTMSRGRGYKEQRIYSNAELAVVVEFMFLTKCLTKDLRKKFEAIKTPVDSPDIVIISSCLWDICRWGPEGVSEYKKNIVKLMQLMKKCLDPRTLVVWTTTPPVGSNIKGGFLIKQIEFMQESCRFEVMEANMFVQQEVVAHGFDVLDLHYYLILQLHKRESDGVHWCPETVRYISNLILTHIVALGHPLPGNFRSDSLEAMILPSTKPLVQDCVGVLQRLDDLSGAQGSRDIGKTRRRKWRRNRRKARPSYQPY